MEIKKFNDMKAYMLKPNRLFTSKKNTIGGTNPKTGQGFQKGNTGFRTKDGEVRNVTGKNQFPQLPKEEMQAIIDANPELETPKNFIDAKLLKRRQIKNNPDLVFKRRGPPKANPKNQRARDIKRGEAQINLEGRKLKLKAPSGYQVHHIMPLAGGEELRTGDYAVVSKEMNAKMSKYNKKINKLVNEAYSLDYSKTENLKKLKDINNDLFDIFKTAEKDLPKKYKGLLGFNKLTPVLDTFDDKGRQVFYAEPQGIDYKKSIAGVQGDKVKDTKRSVMQDMIDNAPKFKAALLPGLEQIAEGIKNIPDDIAKKKYFKLGMKALGPLGAYLAVDDTYEALEAGRPVAEALEYGLIGTNIIGSTKDVIALSPEEREARSVVKQAEMTDQITQDESMLDSDFETPKVKSNLNTKEAEKQYAMAKARVKAERDAQEADIARARAVSISGLKDLVTGERFQPQEIPKQFMAQGGIMRLGFKDGPDDPSKRKFMKIAGGLASIPILGKFIKPTMVAAPKVAEVVKRSADGIPEFLGDLITKVVTFGKKNFTGNRADEFADQYRLDDYVVTQQGNKTTIKKVDDKGEFGYKEHEMELETDPETGGLTYNEASARPDAEGKLKDVEEFIDDFDLEEMKKYTYDE